MLNIYLIQKVFWNISFNYCLLFGIITITSRSVNLRLFRNDIHYQLCSLLELEFLLMRFCKQDRVLLKSTLFFNLAVKNSLLYLLQTYFFFGKSLLSEIDLETMYLVFIYITYIMQMSILTINISQFNTEHLSYSMSSHKIFQALMVISCFIQK